MENNAKNPVNNNCIFDVIEHVCSVQNKRLGKYVPAVINEIPVSGLVDSGNTAGNCISWEFAQQLGLREGDLRPVSHTFGTAKSGSSLKVMGKTRKKLKMQLGGLNVNFYIKPYVINIVFLTSKEGRHEYFSHKCPNFFLHECRRHEWGRK